MRIFRIAVWTPLATLTLLPYALLAAFFRWPAWPAVAIIIVCQVGTLYLISYKCGACHQVVYKKENLTGFTRAQLIFKPPSVEKCPQCGADLS